MKEVKKFAEARFLPEFEYEFDPKKPVGFLHENQHETPVSGSSETSRIDKRQLQERVPSTKLA